MIELKAYKVPLRLKLYSEDIRGVREIYDSRKQIRKHTQVFVHNDWISVEGKYEDIVSQVDLKSNQIGYK